MACVDFRSARCSRVAPKSGVLTLTSFRASATTSVRTTAVVLEVDRRRDAEVVDEAREHAGVGAGPRIDRLLVIADAKDVLVIARQRGDHAILNRIQILELIDEDDVPARSHGGTGAVALQQVRGLEHEHVEVDDPLALQISLVLLEQERVVLAERVAAKAMRREAIENAAMPALRSLDAAKDAELVLFVRDAEARLEQHVGAELAQEFSAERVNRSALDLRRRERAEPTLEAMLDLARRFIRECECADARGIDAVCLDQKANALDETERLPRARAGEDERRARTRLDRVALRRRWRERFWGIGGGRRCGRRRQRAVLLCSTPLRACPVNIPLCTGESQSWHVSFCDRP